MEITREMRQAASAMLLRNPLWQRLYVNEKGAFFTEESYAKMSVNTPEGYGLIEREGIEGTSDERRKKR